MNNADAAESLWKRRYDDLIGFTQSLSWLDDRADFYKDLACNLKRISGADGVNIRLLSPAQDTFVLYAFCGDVEAGAMQEYEFLSAGAGRMPRLIETGQPIVFDFANPASDDIDWDRGVDDGFSCAVIVALPGAHGMLGAADFLFHSPRSWTPDDVDWLSSLGKFVGAIVGNALLSDNMFSLRVAEERRSLSNEIHDNIAQSISVISLEVDSALDSLKHHDDDTLTRNLDLLKRASVEVEAVVRGELDNLRMNAGFGGTSTMAQLTQMIEAFCTRWGLELELTTSDGIEGQVIPQRTMSQLTRVVNEALVNVMKHAQAHRVLIALKAKDGGLEICVEDDGVGFDVEGISPSHLGLRIMRERLENINASLEITSSPGGGTRLTMSIPYLM
ncbi:sensor histidine kinase [Adlercreutzia sp. ZJ473]|uniref:sensor histidine kinase n=1 Tax=Adlercreutzia sp. ZJ473 TaxID=2722822 RepID=UPI001554C602|nr:ATP-binding protein [Adlercreutzia sp. ZJ473]